MEAQIVGPPAGGNSSYRVTVGWAVNCSGGDRHWWDIEWRDPDTRATSRRVPAFVTAGAYRPESFGSLETFLRPGVAVYPHIRASCETTQTDGHPPPHASPVGVADGNLIVTPPVLERPKVSVAAPRQRGQRRRPRRRSVPPTRLPPRKKVYVLVVWYGAPEADERVTFHFEGAGLNVRRTLTADRVRRPIRIPLRTRRPGTIRHWVVMHPYDVRSNEVTLRVRRKSRSRR